MVKNEVDVGDDRTSELEEQLTRTARDIFTPAFPKQLTLQYHDPVILDVGATSTVWRAYEKRLERNVAIKVFDRGERSIDDVLSEARAACAVRSEHVVQVIAVETSGIPAIIMELVAEVGFENAQLERGLSAYHTRPSSLAEAVRWASEAAIGVQAAHLQGITHRDLKPRNLMITPISRRAKVTDFGLATGIRGPVLSGTAGTPTHMAPEQARGELVNLDTRRLDDRRRLVAVDVFGLGAVAYDLITGRPPYHADDAHTAFERAMRCERRSLRESKSCFGPVPALLADVLEKAMSRDPKARYLSAGALSADLDSWRADRPTSLVVRHSPLRLKLWMRRNPALVALFLLALGVLGTVVFLRSLLNAERRSLDAIKLKSAIANDELSVVNSGLLANRAQLDEQKEQARIAGRERDEAVHQRDEAVHQWDEKKNELAVLSARADRERVTRDQAVEERDTARREGAGDRAKAAEAKARELAAEQRADEAKKSGREAQLKEHAATQRADEAQARQLAAEQRADAAAKLAADRASNINAAKIAKWNAEWPTHGTPRGPDQMTAHRMKTENIYSWDAVMKVCIGKNGSVETVQLLDSSHYPPYDEEIIKDVKTWRYEPFILDGSPVEVCGPLHITGRL